MLIGYFGSAFSKVDLAPPFSKVDFQRLIFKGGFGSTFPKVDLAPRFPKWIWLHLFQRWILKGGFGSTFFKGGFLKVDF
jgi:hypothetical protein